MLIALSAWPDHYIVYRFTSYRDLSESHTNLCSTIGSPPSIGAHTKFKRNCTEHIYVLFEGNSAN
jgi:hypothetical protein